MDIELHSQGTFQGIVVLEYVENIPISVIAKRIIDDSNPERKCVICGKTRDLLRCSRCKSSWYCGVRHQTMDWSTHQLICKPQKVAKNKLTKKDHRAGTLGDDIAMGECKIRLRCPLTMVRIRTPVQGIKCQHPQCMDLESYLSYANHSGNWQCPICSKPLPWQSLIVDDSMQKILADTDDEIDYVKLFPNGSYKVITLADQKAADQAHGKGRSGEPAKKKKKIEIIEL